MLFPISMSHVSPRKRARLHLKGKAKRTYGHDRTPWVSENGGASLKASLLGFWLLNTFKNPNVKFKPLSWSSHFLSGLATSQLQTCCPPILPLKQQVQEPVSWPKKSKPFVYHSTVFPKSPGTRGVSCYTDHPNPLFTLQLVFPKKSRNPRSQLFCPQNPLTYPPPPASCRLLLLCRLPGREQRREGRAQRGPRGDPGLRVRGPGAPEPHRAGAGL